MDRVINILQNRLLWRTGPRVVYIGRANTTYKLARSVFANPFAISKNTTREEVIAQYEEWAITWPPLMAALRALPLDQDYVFA